MEAQRASVSGNARCDGDIRYRRRRASPATVKLQETRSLFQDRFSYGQPVVRAETTSRSTLDEKFNKPARVPFLRMSKIRIDHARGKE